MVRVQFDPNHLITLGDARWNLHHDMGLLLDYHDDLFIITIAIVIGTHHHHLSFIIINLVWWEMMMECNVTPSTLTTYRPTKPVAPNTVAVIPLTDERPPPVRTIRHWPPYIIIIITCHIVSCRLLCCVTYLTNGWCTNSWYSLLYFRWCCEWWWLRLSCWHLFTFPWNPIIPYHLSTLS